MAEVKPIRMQKRRAMGENVQVMKKGGAAKPSAPKGNPFAKKGGKC